MSVQSHDLINQFFLLNFVRLVQNASELYLIMILKIICDSKPIRTIVVTYEFVSGQCALL